MPLNDLIEHGSNEPSFLQSSLHTPTTPARSFVSEMMLVFSTITPSLSFLHRPLLGRSIFRQIAPKLSSLGKFSTREKGNSTIHKDPSCSLSSLARRNSSTENRSEDRSMSDPTPSSQTNTHSRKSQIHRRTRVDLGSHSEHNSRTSSERNASSPTKKSPATNFTSDLHESSLPSEFGKKRRNVYQNHSPAGDKLDSLFSYPQFDICPLGKGKDALLGASLHGKIKESCTENQGVTEQTILRPGMVLLKDYISHNEQAEIVESCRRLGLGPGGFYQPGYKYGAKLRLQMMCLGLDWDPQTRKYGKKRSVDDCEPPSIPDNFSRLVKGAIQKAHSLIKKETGLSNVEDILPSINPDICIVNFYSTNGRLGLHQDRDESRESLLKGLPVVSISIGDSAEFLYGDQRDIEKAEKVVLESGDVLIFGGESRHVFHGVSTIIPNSAPEMLLNQTHLRPGRLNLTFRQF
ncbi:hypothetical protein L6164_002456 [Bauhinia variegata]|uniref:Uncharacterized protein n=1 Tax=Bauhinia variegata TaxID=167791 RepID=A0ACB9PY25_BAUVA|nr:hypothetical protein L6164_002456 [Bauhinia variegata]